LRNVITISMVDELEIVTNIIFHALGLV